MFDLNSVLKKINSWIKAVFGKEFNRLLGSSEEYFEAEESSYGNDRSFNNIISFLLPHLIEIEELNQEEILRREQEKKENQQADALKVVQAELDVTNALSDDIESVEATTAKADALKAAQAELDVTNALSDDIESVEATTAKADALKVAQAELDVANALPSVYIESIKVPTAKADALKATQAELAVTTADGVPYTLSSVYIGPIKVPTAEADALKAAQAELDVTNALSDDIESVEATTAKAESIFIQECSDGVATVSGGCIVDEGLN